MEINKSYPCNTKNYRKGRYDSIKYIVIHYVGASGSAKNNAQYYASSYAGASAHFYVGHASEDGAIYQSVAPKDCAWHCGHDKGGRYYHSECRNDNAIGIEMCCHKNKNGVWYFDEVTIDKTVELTRYLMKEYGIDVDRVIRHYDVTHKTCPAPFVNEQSAWERFKERLIEEEKFMTDAERALLNDIAKKVEILSNPIIYSWVDENMPLWARATVQKLMNRGVLVGDEEGRLNLDNNMLRMLVINDRAGLYD